MATIQFRIDPLWKARLQKTLEAMGLDISGAMSMYIRKIILTKSIPFEVAAGSYSKTQLQKMDREVRWALKYGKRHNSFEELARDILGDEDYEAWKDESAARRRNEAVSARLPATAALRVRRSEATHRRHSTRKRHSASR